MRGVEEQVHRLALTDAGLRRVPVGVHAEELLVGSFGDIAGETADDYVVESTGVPHRRETALEGGGGHSTSWCLTHRLGRRTEQLISDAQMPRHIALIGEL